jgi:hypothetical protein
LRAFDAAVLVTWVQDAMADMPALRRGLARHPTMARDDGGGQSLTFADSKVAFRACRGNRPVCEVSRRHVAGNTYGDQNLPMCACRTRNARNAL